MMVESRQQPMQLKEQTDNALMTQTPQDEKTETSTLQTQTDNAELSPLLTRPDDNEISLGLIFQQNMLILDKLTKMEKNYNDTNNKIINITQNLNTLKKEIDGVVESQTHINAQFEEEKAKVKKINISVQKLLNKEATTKIDISNLAKSLDDLKDIATKATKAVNDLEQYGRRNMLDIRGIPRSKGENTDQIVIDVGKQMDVDLKLKDIEISHRTSNNPDAPIIVKFMSRRKRDTFFKNRFNLKGRTTEDIGYGNKNKIFVNESLTATNGRLFRESRNKLNEKNYHSVWTRNGVVHAKKDEHSANKIIHSFTDLKEILNNE